MQHKLLQQPPACQPPLQAPCTSSLLCLCLHQPGRRPRPPPWHRGGAAALPELGDAILPLVCEGTSSVRHERSCSTCRKMRSCHDICAKCPTLLPLQPHPLLTLQPHPLLTLQPHPPTPTAPPSYPYSPTPFSPYSPTPFSPYSPTPFSPYSPTLLPLQPHPLLTLQPHPLLTLQPHPHTPTAPPSYPYSPTPFSPYSHCPASLAGPRAWYVRLHLRAPYYRASVLRVVVDRMRPQLVN